MTKAIIPLVLAMILAASATNAAIEVIRSPELNTQSTVGPGEVVYTETIVKMGKLVSQTAVLKEDTAPAKKGPALPAGTHLIFIVPEVNSPMHFSGAVPGRRTACLESAFQTGGLGGAKRFICLQDTNDDGRLDRPVVKGYKLNPAFVRPAYEVQTTVKQDPSSRTTFKGEIVYQGAASGTLRLGYREYADDMARPAFFQDATYELASDGQTEVRFKGALIRVFAADNSAIRFEVVEPFKW
jgi:hypothetical protein